MSRIFKKPNLTIWSVCVATAALLSSVAGAQDPIKRGDLGTGTVFGVNKPGDAKFNSLRPDFGDRLETSLYKPQDDSNKDLGLTKGGSYTMLMLTGKDKQQAFVYWETPSPAFQDILLYQSVKLDSKGGEAFDLQRGDTMTIQAQREKNDVVNVTFSFFRDKKATGTFSFNLNGKPNNKDPYEGLAGSYKEKSGGEMQIRKADDAKKEAGPWWFVLKGKGDWACDEGQESPGEGKEKVFFIQFSEGNFKGQQYNIIRDKDGKVKELQLVGGSKAIWVKQ
jgi:hypothetical protein